MKVKVETYRKFEIFFDPEDEIFSSIVRDTSKYCDNSFFKESKSYAAVKKAIDEFIKENNTFNPFFVTLRPDRHCYQEEKRTVKIIGIRKDNRFIAEDKNGNQIQISEYDEKDYIISRPEDEQIFATIAVLSLAVDEARKKLEDAQEMVTAPSLKSLKPEYIQK